MAEGSGAMARAPTVKLTIALVPLPPLREKLPALADWAEQRGISLSDKPGRCVFVTRDDARKIVESRQDVGERELVFIDCKGVEVLSPGFADELLKAWPLAEVTRANEDVKVSWDLARERHPR